MTITRRRVTGNAIEDERGQAASAACYLNLFAAGRVPGVDSSDPMTSRLLRQLALLPHADPHDFQAGMGSL